MSDNYFSVLNSVDVSGKTEKKNNLTYLSWVWAWGEVKKRHPDATYKIYENADGWNYHTDGRTCWVKTGVTINGIEHIEYLPVMDYRNQSISIDRVTSTDVNKAIQRSITKAIARHGLGLFVYAGEDVPESEEAEPIPKKAPSPKDPPPKDPPVFCSKCHKPIEPFIGVDGKTTSVKRLVERSKEMFEGKIFCTDCAREYIGGNVNNA